MKIATIRRTDSFSRPSIPYPNAATRKEKLHKFLDLLLIGATGIGLTSVFLFLLVIR